MIELRGVVAAAGVRPVTAVLRGGEVVRVDGPAGAVSALLDVIAGRRAPRAGEVIRRGDAGAVALVRAGERSPPGLDEEDAVAAWAALAGAAAPDLETIGARGRALATPVWLVDGALADDDEREVQAAAEAVRTGAGVLVWTDPDGTRGPADRVIVVEPHDGAASPRRPAAAPVARARTVPWTAIARFAGAAAGSQGALAIGAVAAVWVAACAATVAAHEGLWFADGAAAALPLVARLGAIGAAALAAIATATRTHAAAAWPAMLRETGAGPVARGLVLAGGDLGAAGVTGGVAALPALWASDPAGLAAAALATLAAAVVAGAIARRAGGPLGAALGAVVAAGGALALLW